MSVNNLSLSDNGLKLIENSEGLRLVPYQDSVGVWTDGYGNTHGVTPGTPITQAEAEADLRSNVLSAVQSVNALTNVTLNQNQFDALVDFVFNLGEGNFRNSTLLKKLNQGDYAGAALEFPRWNLAGGKVLSGLTTRRAAEQTLFNTPIAANPVVPDPVPVSNVSSVFQNVVSFLTKLRNQ